MHHLILLGVSTRDDNVSTAIQLVDGRRLTLGRSSAADYAFKFDDYMSRMHFSIEPHGTKAIVRDLRSKHGTFVNHRRVHCGQLRDGDLIMAGRTVFQFVAHPAPDTQSLPSTEKLP